MAFYRSTFVKALVLAGLLGGFSQGAGFAATITVQNLTDSTVTDASCSLREAIDNANSDDPVWSDCTTGSGADTIGFSVSGTILLSTTLPAFFSIDLITIDGSGQTITLSGQGAVRVVDVTATGKLKLQNLTVTHGLSQDNPFFGGGIRVANGGIVTVERVTLSANEANIGGAVYNLGSFTAIESNITGNTGYVQGGAIANSGAVTLDRCTVSDNTGPFDGGAIHTQGGSLTVVSSTFSANHANFTSGHGGAIYLNSGMVSIANSTFSGNESALGGSAIWVEAGSLTLTDSIVANGVTGANCGGSINDGGGNLTWPGASCPGVVADPLLFPLYNNGGPTLTFELQPGSPAYDSAANVFCPAFDQRGLARPRGSSCDVGSVEGIGTPGYIFLGDFEIGNFTGWSSVSPVL